MSCQCGNPHAKHVMWLDGTFCEECSDKRTGVIHAEQRKGLTGKAMHDFIVTNTTATIIAEPDTKIYLSGPMTGIVDFNAPEFARYAERYRALGFHVISPSELDSEEEKHAGEYRDFIKRDVRLFLDSNIDRVYLLPGWMKSKGARLEKHVAEMFGIPIYDADTGEPWEETIAQEAYRLVHGDRGATYSHPLDDFGRTAGIVNALLHHKLSQPLSEEDIALIMIAVKLSRLANSPDHRDSVVDLAGYAECYQMVREERVHRGPKG